MSLTHKVIIPIWSKDVLRWFVGGSLVERAIERLEDVRGVHNLVLLSHDLKVAREVVDEIEMELTIECVRLPPKHKINSFLELIRQYAEKFVEKEPEILIGLNPAYPFLDRGRMESAIHAVKKKRSAVTVVPTRYLSATHRHVKVESGFSLVEACLALHSDQLKNNNTADVLSATSELIEIDEIEAVNATTPEGRKIAEAILTHGDV